MIRGVKTLDTRNGTLHKRVLISTAVNRLKAGKDFAHETARQSCLWYNKSCL